MSHEKLEALQPDFMKQILRSLVTNPPNEEAEWHELST